MTCESRHIWVVIDVEDGKLCGGKRVSTELLGCQDAKRTQRRSKLCAHENGAHLRWMPSCQP
jgi:hypothetical protein